MCDFKALSHETFNVGKRVKSSKKKFIFKFELDKQDYTLEIYLSKLSGKIRIFLNGDMRVNSRQTGAMNTRYPLKIRTRTLYVQHIGDNLFDLLVGRHSFHKSYEKSWNEPKFSDEWSESKPEFEEPSSDEEPKRRGSMPAQDPEDEPKPKPRNSMAPVRSSNPFENISDHELENEPSDLFVPLPRKSLPAEPTKPKKEPEVDLLDINYEPSKPQQLQTQIPPQSTQFVNPMQM